MKNNFEEKMNELGRVIVITTPSYNGARFLDETIASVVSQRGNFCVRYHVQDGGSTDDTIDILKKWQQSLEGENPMGGAPVRFSWQSEKDRGMYDAISRGFELAFADFDPEIAAASSMGWINTDDLLATSALATINAILYELPNCYWVTGMAALINEFGVLVDVINEPEAFAHRTLAEGGYDNRGKGCVTQEGTFWRRPLWDAAGGLNRSLKLAGDWDLWRRFANFAPLVKAKAVLGLHRRHSGQLTENMHQYYVEVEQLNANRPDASALPEEGFITFWSLHERKWLLMALDPTKKRT